MAQALFGPQSTDDVGGQDCTVVFSAEKAKPLKNKGRKKLAAPVVETSVRRCTRSSALRDGFKQVFEELPQQPRKKRLRAKPISSPMAQHDSPSGPLAQEQPIVPPEMPIEVLQAAAANLEMDPALLTKVKLMVAPSEDSPPSAAK